VLFVESGDSFSWNVVDRLPLPRGEILVRPASAGIPAGVDAVVLGPGPRDPVRAGLLGLVEEAARRRLPVLGICLGHQALGLAFGARLERVEPVHGRVSRVRFERSRLFPGIEGTLGVMRYHSLALACVGPPLRVVAATVDGIPMAIEHESLPLAGLQFHPDSHFTERGEELLARFFEAIP
jgi:anthranilate synthase/aminodeoxychorismate synthase-like glutamine amidotransferase